jgi:ribosomal protein S27E
VSGWRIAQVREKAYYMPKEYIDVKCDNCSHTNAIDRNDMEIELVASYKRGMGPENEYHSSTEISCEKCGENITIDYSAWEYPAGCYNCSDIDISGGQLLNFFNETEMFQEKYYDLDEKLGLYLPQQDEIISGLNIGIANLIIRSQNNPQLLTEINPREFEEFVSDLFKREGFTVELTPRTRDGGKDIIAIKSDLDIKLKFLIECKRYQHSNKVGVDVVRQLYGVQHAVGANKSIVVTTSSFTQGAIDFSKQQNTEWHMSLIDYEKLLAWVQKEYGNMPLF